MPYGPYKKENMRKRRSKVADAKTTAVGEYRPIVKGSILLEIGISIFTCSLSLLKTASILVFLET
jgi:hypothetical protein